MKKLLSMALAMMLLFASVGVFAEGEATEEPVEPVDPNVVLYTGFEEGTLNDNGFVEQTSSNSGKYWALEESGAYAGNRCLKVAFYSADGSYRVQANRLEIEPANAVYKLSFWFKYGVFTAGNVFAPRILIQDGTDKASPINMLYSVKENGDIIPTCNVDEWTYYEVYFAVTDATTHLTIQLRNAGTAKAKDAFYYDEFKLEKVEDGLSYNFAEGDSTKAGFAMSDLTSVQFGATTGNNRALGTELTIDNETVTLYPVVLTAKPKTEATGVVRVITRYIPNALPKQATMVLAVYKDDAVTKLPVLQGMETDDLEYATTTRNTETDGTETSFNILQNAGIQYTDIDMSKYEEGSYLKAFLWSSAQGMVPLDSDVVFGK